MAKRYEVETINSERFIYADSKEEALSKAFDGVGVKVVPIYICTKCEVLDDNHKFEACEGGEFKQVEEI